MKSGFAALFASCLLAAPAAAQPVPVPKLIVAISVDQFSAQLFQDYRPHFTGGLRRVAEGIVFTRGYQAHGVTETCPGHSTILTGSHPTRTGIIANDWTDFAAPRSDKEVYCAEDERVPGSTADDYTVSDVHLRVTTLGDRMKQANPQSRVVSVAGKDRSAVMMGGHDPDQRWWWKKDRFVQNSSEAPAPVAAQVNAAIAAGIARQRPALSPPPFCAGRDRAIDVGGGRTVGTFRFARKAGDAEAFSASPEIDASTLAMAAALTQQMQLGRGPATDLLAIGLSGTDFIGHRYGPGGVEMCLQLMSLDADLDGFFDFLDQSGIDYAVVLTADHGGNDIPERQRLQGKADAIRLDPAAGAAQIGEQVAKRLGLRQSVFEHGWYLSPEVSSGRRSEAIALARQLLTAHPQVHAVYSKDEVAAHPLSSAPPESWSILDRLRASFDPKLSPDLEVVYKANVNTIFRTDGKSLATHGSVWDHDRNVPIMFWWKGAPRDERTESAMTVDIMPTLASLIGLSVPQAEIDGHCLDITSGATNNCR